MQAVNLTGTQIRAARGALNWSVQRLADETGVGTATIVRYELSDSIPRSRKGNLKTIQKALEAAGIEFTQAEDGSPGIIIRTEPSKPT
ncbi:helix-turn-helix domain-containing protein [Ovoidimarina sediminis]|uniref:helix-turn-helix domain-containing protein n=1 Tax=Ovoidimarina sediminis TaxID=3079856 RepID=UPI0029065D2D|nr:helix-turn-helix transcriptional regulator [Rhodophyticola sp. MJ-SS7]MDU8946136.1 helix-turn-helix transcriptional regulator [Rhodophyticola sp. MJ-SS7]